MKYKNTKPHGDSMSPPHRGGQCRHWTNHICCRTKCQWDRHHTRAQTKISPQQSRTPQLISGKPRRCYRS